MAPNTRSVRSRSGRLFVGFTPAVSDAAGKRMRREVRRWRLHLRTRTTLNDLAREINPVTRGWLNYYGQFHRSALSRTFNSIDAYLARWLTRKYKRFRNRPRRAYRFLLAVKQRQPGLFAHWRVVATPTG